MNILIAPNAFKGSLSALEVAEIIQSNLLKINPKLNCKCLPIADGGDGTFDVLSDYYLGAAHTFSTTDLLNRKINAPIFLTENSTAIIELSHVAGLSLLKPSEYDPLNTHTFGVGDLIRSALDLNCTKIILAIGGSGTLDMGFGALRALGFRFLDKDGNELSGGGGFLKRIVDIDSEKFDARLLQVDFQIACDVENPLLGEFGAAHIFGKQKGASEEEIIQLHQNHQDFAQLIKKQFHIDISKIKHGGAAGGIAAGFYALCGAKLRSGSELIFDCLNMDDALESCDILITGEGRIDSQSSFGKAPYVLAQKAKLMRKRVIAFCGSYESLINSPFDQVFPIKKDCQTLNEAITFAKNNLADAILYNSFLL
ncbi:glycerate kinase [Ancylomarina euxinus]|uniref:Glycerate kinase n=1 Tax=Ancylomarina euxinus TaxID=2283627 RepID=A0A425XYH3_9BACT|nr:glycerate kinase [Ancylomarina euxinus]MCZ4695726.1 glycerate kinase [Ancylomarina euxinus]MUP16179.1 glycerate kinase [Ancylomarina euxinus]RRG20040.1 glycerate kinase [Ancylomarina euxinus]